MEHNTPHHIASLFSSSWSTQTDTSETSHHHFLFFFFSQSQSDQKKRKRIQWLAFKLFHFIFNHLFSSSSSPLTSFDHSIFSFHNAISPQLYRNFPLAFSYHQHNRLLIRIIFVHFIFIVCKLWTRYFSHFSKPPFVVQNVYALEFLSHLLSQRYKKYEFVHSSS